MTDTTLVHERSDAEEFVRYSLGVGAIAMGEFKINSERISPYYVNTNKFSNGSQLSYLTFAYTRCIHESEIGFDTLFGPAYKGIPLSVLIAAKLFEEYRWDVEACYNRKEVKDYGEAGQIIGNLKEGARVMVVDNVITDGATKREAFEILYESGAVPVAVIIAFDRGEFADDPAKSAIESFGESTGVPVIAIANVGDLMNVLREEDRREDAAKIADYLAKYGPRAV